MILDLSSQSSDLIIFLFDNWVQSLNFLRKQGNFVFKIRYTFVVIGWLLEFFIELLYFIASYFELITQFANLTWRYSQVLLGRPHLFSQIVVFCKKFLNSGLISLAFLVVKIHSMPEIIYFVAESALLLTWHPQILLNLFDLSTKHSNFIIFLFNNSIQSFKFLR